MFRPFAQPEATQHRVSAGRYSCPLIVLTAASLFLWLLPVGFCQQSETPFPIAISDRSLPLERSHDNPIESLKNREVLPPGPNNGGSTPHAKHGKGPNPKHDVSRIGDRKVDGGLNLYSMEREQQLGRELATEIEQESTLVTDPIITEYVARVGQNIANNSDAKVPFTIKVVEDDEINAFALPGGFLYVNTGLLLAVDNEAELASVMAHEIAHVAARHITKNSTRAELFNMASIPLVMFGGPIVFAAREALDVAEPLTLLKFSRAAEREADLLGIEYCYKAGYDPQAFVTFFEKLKTDEKKKKHNLLAKAFSTHPMTEDRIKRAQQEIAQDLPPHSEYIIDTSEFDEVKARLIKREHDLNMDNGHGAKPTLRKRTQPTGDPSPQDDDGPVLRKKPPQN